MNPLFKIKSHIHLSDVGQDAKIRLGNLVDKFQNAGWMHFQELQKRLPSMDPRLLYFVVSQKVDIHTVPSLNEPVVLQSFITDANRFKITRLVEIRDAAKKLIASQIEDAFVVNKLTGKIARLPENYPIHLMVDDLKKLTFHRDKINVPAGGHQTESNFRVLPRDVDNYGHMNNARYLDLIAEHPDRIREVSINYLHPAKLGMELEYLRTQVDQSVFYTVRNGKQIMSKIKLALK
ncbi:thioesterase [Lentilactobacillus hilgardii]|nr:acyl-ACP thioesterase domain-containing protein [Lentilactobacillus hilgardii]MCV3741269.1 thioesterase [Lentilactobacillus hilgardii]